MASSQELLNYLSQTQISFDDARIQYLKKLSDLTNRNTICYYSGWMQKGGYANSAIIMDSDMNGFMENVYKLDKSKGLDLILHTLGGDVTAAEGIGNYLRGVFGNDIRIIVPQLAMSAGTILSCIAREILMGKHSSLGPIDIQHGEVSIHSILEEVGIAKQEIMVNQASLNFWGDPMIRYPRGFIMHCQKVMELSSELVNCWLNTGDMFKSDSELVKMAKIANIMGYFNNSRDRKVHARHITAKQASEVGLKIFNLEDEQELQDAVLSVHHLYMHTLTYTNAIKIIENQDGRRYIQQI